MTYDRRPEGVTEAISNFYNGFLVLVFVLITLVFGAFALFALSRIFTPEVDLERDVWIFNLIIYGLYYLGFLISSGLIATALSIRRHLLYQSDLLEIIASNGAPQKARGDSIF